MGFLSASATRRWTSTAQAPSGFARMHDYQGRLIYELLQNADDAMAGDESRADRVSFRVTDTDLWVANTGRPLTEADIRGLCGIGAGTKDSPSGPRRASIGPKGMGFTSIS